LTNFLCCFLLQVLHIFLYYLFNKPKKVNLQKESKTSFKWQKDSIIDLGLLNSNVTYNFSTKIYNAGIHPLFIQDINTSCGCTKTKFSKIKILPNDSSLITGTISTSKSPKDFVIISFKANTNQLNHNLYLSYKTKLQ
jgi:hypothetical protein